MENEMRTLIFLAITALCSANTFVNAAAPQKKAHEENIKTFQKMIASNPDFCLTPQEWQSQNNELIFKRSHCGFSAANLIESLTGTEKHVWELHQLIQMNLQKTVSSCAKDNTIFGAYPAIHKQMIKLLLGPSSHPHNTLYLYIMRRRGGNGCHAFVLENKDNAWFLYQSFENQFTMAEWVGSHPWRSPKKFPTKGHEEHYKVYTKLHEEFGNCKPLNTEELFNFLHIIPHYIAKDTNQVLCYINKWDNTQIQQTEAANLMQKISNPRSFANITMALSLLDRSNQDKKSDSTK